MGGIAKRTFSPVNFVLDTVSGPSFGVGNIVAGKPFRAAAGFASIPSVFAETFTAPVRLSPPAIIARSAVEGGFKSAFFNPYSGTQALTRATERRTPSVALEERGVNFNSGALGFAQRLGIDIFTDPLTYLTFGLGGAVRGGSVSLQKSAAAVKAARARVNNQIRQAGNLGVDIDQRSLARIEAPLLRAEAANPRTFKIGLRVPFTRSLDLPLVESRAIAAGAEKLGRSTKSTLSNIPGVTRIGAGVRKIVLPRGSSGPVRHLYEDTRRLGEIEGARWNVRVRALSEDINELEAKLKLKRGTLERAIALHLDSPAQGARRAGGALPDEAIPLAERARSMFDEIGQLELRAGIERRSISNYVPHILAGHGSRSAYDKYLDKVGIARRTVDSVDNPFFVHERTTRRLTDLVELGKREGFDVEQSISRLVAARSDASIIARVKKALDDAIAGEYGRPAAATSRSGNVRFPVRQARHTELPTGVIDEGRQPALVGVRQAADAADDPVAGAIASYISSRYVPPSGIARLSPDEAVLEANLGRGPKNAKPHTVLSEEQFDEVVDVWKQMRGARRYHDGVEIPADIARQLDEVHDAITPHMTTNTGLFNTMRFLERATSQWKSLALATTGFIIRNAQDDLLRAYWAGARNPASFTQTFRVIRHMQRQQAGKATRGIFDRRALDPTKGPKVTIGKGPLKGSYTAEEWMGLMEAYGVVRIGFVRQEVISVLADRLATGGVRIPRTSLVVRTPGQGRYARAIQTAEQYREDMTRGGLFMELLKRGDDPTLASRTVRDYLFDYGEVGAFVAGARRFWMPFITFPSKALPHTFRQLGRRPGTFANINKLRMQFERETGADLSLVPADRSSAIPLPPSLFQGIVGQALGLGGDSNQTVLFDPARVTGFATLDMLDPRPERLRQNYAAGLLNPFVRTPPELILGTSTFTGRPFPKSGSRAPQSVRTASRIPGVGPLLGFRSADDPDAKRDLFTDKPIASFSPRVNAILRTIPAFGQTDQLFGGSDTSRTGQGRLLFGLQLSPFDRARAEYYARRFGDR